MRECTTRWGCLGLTLTALAAGCSEPELASDLVTAGPPTVSAVTVTGEAGSEATYCNPAMGDHTPIPCTAGQAVAPVGDVRPLAWRARVVFKELLDPSIEVIDDRGAGSIRAARPFTVTCGGAALDYDGFYDPSGNHETTPPGPALVVHGVADPAAAAGAPCTLAIRPGAITDKDGEPAPDDIAFAFTIAPLRAVTTTPADHATDVDPTAAIAITVNSHVDAASLAGHVALRSAAGAVSAAVAVAVDQPSTIAITPDAPLAAATEYTVAVDTSVRDTLGAALAAELTFTFTTRP